MTRVIICRHGNTFDEGDIITRVGARTDMPLSSSGVQQAELLAQEFSPKYSGLEFEYAFCSPLKRTRQTGDIILSAGHGLSALTTLPFLTEIDYGIDENKPEAEVVERLGQNAIDLWDSDAVPPQGWQVQPSEIIQSWKELFLNACSTKGDILIVSSNGITRFALDAVDEVVTHAPRKLRTGAFGVVEIVSGRTIITSWGRRLMSGDGQKI